MLTALVFSSVNCINTERKFYSYLPSTMRICVHKLQKSAWLATSTFDETFGNKKEDTFPNQRELGLVLSVKRI
jgi:hypothetical protein